jgi:hypothetical protein
MTDGLKVRFRCPVCGQAATAACGRQRIWTCPSCEHALSIEGRGSNQAMESCAICGNSEFYKKKNFPHWLGLSVLTAASIGFLVLQAFYWQWTSWAILIGSAVVDGLLYLGVGDVIVCYRCGAHYVGVQGDAAHAPFDLTIAERYRQERIRRAQMQVNSRSS